MFAHKHMCLFGTTGYVKSVALDLALEQLQILHPSAPQLPLHNGWNKTITAAIYDSVLDYEP